MSEQDYEQLTLFPVDSHASHFLLPGSDEAQKMTVISGQKCLELSWNSGPLGSLVRMLLELSAWRSTRCYLTWKASATPAKRLLFRLVPSMPRTGGTGALLWPTVRASENGDYQYSHGDHGQKIPTLSGAAKLWCGTPTANPTARTERFRAGRTPNPQELATMWPTPTARDYKGANSLKHLHRETDGNRNHAYQLPNAVKLLTTPCASDAVGSTGGGNHRSLRTDAQGQLNPDWVEWLMGFPIGWTSLTCPEQQPTSKTGHSG